MAFHCLIFLARKSEEGPLPYCKTGAELGGIHSAGSPCWCMWYRRRLCYYLCIWNHCFFWFTSHDRISTFFVLFQSCIVLEDPPCSLFSLCFFLLVVVALLLAQWLNSLGTKYQMFTLSMWTTLLNPIGRWWYWQHSFSCVMFTEHVYSIIAWFVLPLFCERFRMGARGHNVREGLVCLTFI